MEFPVFHDWLQGQEGVYAKFKNSHQHLESHGLSDDSVVTECKGGMFIVFRPPDTLAGSIAEVSRRIGKLVPGTVAYRADQLHTTISDFGVVAHNQLGNSTVRGDDKVLRAMKTGVETALAKIGPLARQCEVAYSQFFVNATTVILAGHPNPEWFTAVQVILAECEEAGVSLRLPWGSHITIARFGQKHSPAVAKELLAYLDSLSAGEPIGSGRPIAIDVGSFQFNSEGFELTIAHRFSL